MLHKSVLIVDDEVGMRKALYEILTRKGYRVSTASNGSEAMEKLKVEDYGMIIADVRMPKMGGIDVLKEIKKRTPDKPVVMITAYGQVEDAVEAMKHGAFDYILKPFSSETIESVVHRAVGSPLEPKGNGYKSIKIEGNGNKCIIGISSKMVKLLDFAKEIAQTKATVLIQGESGTGKELFARLIHQNSLRKECPFVAVNCAALPEGLLESELFGHEKGSFTGAIATRIGKFEMAHRGTLLLDEVAEMNLLLQAKLLRAIQEQEVDRLGGRNPISVDIRIIATTNKNLVQAVSEGKFREDLFYRLNVVPLVIPPLCERKEDIPVLVEYFLKKYCLASGKKVLKVKADCMDILMKYHWPGNVRELENVIERAVILNQTDYLIPSSLCLQSQHTRRPGTKEESLSESGVCIKTNSTVKKMERELIFKTLKEASENRTKAAKLLGISIRTLRNKLKEYRQEQLAIVN